MSDDVILLEVDSAVATVTLNRPQAMNALNRALRKRLAEVMRQVDADDAVRAVILTGAGERAFTAGLDLKELGSEAGALGSANATEGTPAGGLSATTAALRTPRCSRSRASCTLCPRSAAIDRL